MSATPEILDLEASEVRPFDCLGEQGFVAEVEFGSGRVILRVGPLWAEEVGGPSVEPVLFPSWGELTEYDHHWSDPVRVIRGAPVPPLRQPRSSFPTPVGPDPAGPTLKTPSTETKDCDEVLP